MIGPNGSGKTTTISIITSLLKPTQGEASINGYPSHSLKARQYFGYVPDELLLPETLTGREHLEFVSKMYDSTQPALIEKLVDLMQLTPAMNLLISEYSHGMKKKLQLISALIHDPQLLILDEPFRGLDPEGVILFKRIIQKRKDQKKSIFIATHDLLSAQVLCDRVGILSKGSMVAEGYVADLLQQYQVNSLEDCFMVASGLIERGIEVEKIIHDL